MVAPVRSPTIVPNIAIPNSLTQQEQTAEIFYQVKEWLKAGGGSVLLSNNGTLDPGANPGDNIASRADVPMGAAGTGAWVYMEFAAGTISNSVHHVLLGINDAATPYQTAVMYSGPGGRSDDGSTTSLPTLTGTWTTALTFTLNPFSTTQNLRASTWRTTTPNRPQRFILKQQGTAGLGLLWEVISLTDAEGGGSGAERWAHFIAGNADNSSFVNSNLYRAIDAAASAQLSTLSGSAMWSLSSTWTAGLDGLGDAHSMSILVGQNPAGGRILGTMVDVYAIPSLFPFGFYLDAAEVAASQDPLRVSFGDVAFFWPNGVSIE